MTWQIAPHYVRTFNGLRMSVVLGDVEKGVFEEPHSPAGQRWSVRSRPVKNGEATDSWGYPLPFRTKRKAIAFVENSL